MKKKFGMYRLPLDVKFCTKCVISNQRPSSVSEPLSSKTDGKEVIGFDEDGVCSACRYHEKKEKEINWEEREKKLIELLDRYRSKSGNYDVVIPGSGGKDSGFTAHILKYKYGLNPLTVTWAPHLYTDIGWQNFQNWINIGGFDNILYTPNGKLHRLLTKLAFLNLCHLFQPFIVGQKIVGPLIASKFDIKLVMFGENAIEYGNSMKYDGPLMDENLFSVKGRKREKVRFGGILIEDIKKEFGFEDNDFIPYIPLERKLIRKKGIQVHYLSYYLKWDPQENFYYSSKNCGFNPNTERTEGSYSKYSSIDDKIDPFHYYTTLIKFGLGRAAYDAAQEIRTGKITREEGVNLVHKYDQEFPRKYFKDFLEYIDITEEKFWETINKFRSKHLWEIVDGNWKLKYVVS